MPADDRTKVLGLLLMLPLFLFSLTLHEYAHGAAARRCGDPTAEREGRLTLDPRAHIDPLGLLMFVLSSLAGFGFGWARPVPVDPRYFRRPRQAMLWVAAAGPLSNLAQALAAFLVLVLLGQVVRLQLAEVLLGGAGMIFAGASLSTGTLLGCLLREYMVINLALMMFNLIPVPPLDGGRIAVGLLPLRQARALSAVEPFGFLVVLVLAQLGVTGKIVVVPVLGALTALAHILGG